MLTFDPSEVDESPESATPGPVVSPKMLTFDASDIDAPKAPAAPKMLTFDAGDVDAAPQAKPAQLTYPSTMRQTSPPQPAPVIAPPQQALAPLLQPVPQPGTHLMGPMPNQPQILEQEPTQTPRTFANPPILQTYRQQQPGGSVYQGAPVDTSFWRSTSPTVDISNLARTQPDALPVAAAKEFEDIVFGPKDFNLGLENAVSPDEKNLALRGARGLLRGVDALATPRNILAIGGFGALSAFGSVGRAVQAGIGAYAAEQAGQSGLEKIGEGGFRLARDKMALASPEVRNLGKATTDFLQGDVGSAAEELGLGTGDALFAALMARASAKQLPGVAADVGQAWRSWKIADTYLRNGWLTPEGGYPRGGGPGGPGGGGNGGPGGSFIYSHPGSTTPVRGNIQRGPGGSFIATNMPGSQAPVFSTPIPGAAPAEPVAPERPGAPTPTDEIFEIDPVTGQLRLKPGVFENPSGGGGSAGMGLAPKKPGGPPALVGGTYQYPYTDSATGKTHWLTVASTGPPPPPLTTKLLDSIVEEMDKGPMHGPLTLFDQIAQDGQVGTRSPEQDAVHQAHIDAVARDNEAISQTDATGEERRIAAEQAVQEALLGHAGPPSLLDQIALEGKVGVRTPEQEAAHQAHIEAVARDNQATSAIPGATADERQIAAEQAVQEVLLNGRPTQTQAGGDSATQTGNAPAHAPAPANQTPVAQTQPTTVPPPVARADFATPGIRGPHTQTPSGTETTTSPTETTKQDGSAPPGKQTTQSQDLQHNGSAPPRSQTVDAAAGERTPEVHDYSSTQLTEIPLTGTPPVGNTNVQGVAEKPQTATQVAEPTTQVAPTPPTHTQVAVTGNTLAHRVTLRQMGGTWNREAQAWIFPASKAEDVQRVSSSLIVKPYGTTENPVVGGFAPAPKGMQWTPAADHQAQGTTPEAYYEELRNEAASKKQYLDGYNGRLRGASRGRGATFARRALARKQAEAQAEYAGIFRQAAKNLGQLASDHMRSEVEKGPQAAAPTPAPAPKPEVKVEPPAAPSPATDVDDTILRTVTEEIRLAQTKLAGMLKNQNGRLNWIDNKEPFYREFMDVQQEGRELLANDKVGGSEKLRTELRRAIETAEAFDVAHLGKKLEANIRLRALIKENEEILGTGKLPTGLRLSAEEREALKLVLRQQNEKVREGTEPEPAEPLNIQRALAQIQRTGTAREGQVIVKVVPHPSAPGQTDMDAAHWAVEVTRMEPGTAQGKREILDYPAMTLKDAQGVAARALFGRETKPPAAEPEAPNPEAITKQVAAAEHVIQNGTPGDASIAMERLRKLEKAAIDYLKTGHGKEADREALLAASRPASRLIERWDTLPMSEVVEKPAAEPEALIAKDVNALFAAITKIEAAATKAGRRRPPSDAMNLWSAAARTAADLGLTPPSLPPFPNGDTLKLVANELRKRLYDAVEKAAEGASKKPEKGAKGPHGFSDKPTSPGEKEPIIKAGKSNVQPSSTSEVESSGTGDSSTSEEILPQSLPGSEEEGATGTGSQTDAGRLREPVLRPDDQPGASPQPGGRTRKGRKAPRAGRAGAKKPGPDLSHDYEITDADQIGEGNIRTKAENNIAAIKLMRQINSENRPATPEEQAVLAKFTGWGATELSKLFSKNDWEVPKNLKDIRETLDELLTPAEFKAAAGSTVNAHYTSPIVVKAMWDAMRHLGMEGGERVLEPSMGVGNFYGLEPDDLREDSARTGIELDPITGAIAKLLYPGSNVHVGGVQQVPLPNDFFDVAIGNVPFGNYQVSDPEYRTGPVKSFSIHNYFFAKALAKVRPGGVVAFITSSHTMDGVDPKVREYLAEHADLLGAIRLPHNAFKENAGTQVTTDIIFLQKRAEGAAPAGEAWVNTADVEAPDKRTNYATDSTIKIPLNEYYVAHPSMMLGAMIVRQGQGGRQVNALEGTNTPERLAAAVEKLPWNVLQKVEPMQDSAAPERIPLSSLPDPGVVKDGGYVWQDGKMLVREGNELKPASLKDPQIPRVRGMLAVRNAWRNLLQAQENGTDQEAKKARGDLNKIYDAFIVGNGPLSNRDNIRAFKTDPDAPGLLALEDYDPKTKVAKKTDIFRKTTNPRYVPPETAPDAASALAIALNEYGGINWPRIQKLTGLDRAGAEKELLDNGLIYKNPEGGKFETADEYLSGDVRDKLRKAIAAVDSDSDYEPNVEALKKVQPADLGPGEIDARLGAGWIPKDVIVSFLEEKLKVGDVSVGHAEAIATWNVKAWDKTGNATNKEEYGGHGWTGVDLVEDSMNLRTPTVRKPDPDDDEKTVVDPVATAALREKQQKLKDLFRKWIWEDHTRATRLAGIYNERYNNLRLREFDGSHLKFPGMNQSIQLRPHQKNAVWRMLQGGNALLAHCVGAGKAQPLDMDVLTPRGFRPMGDLQVGDLVIAGDGTPTVIEGVYPQGEKEIYRVNFSDGSSTECCDEHLWLTQTYKERNATCNGARLGKVWPCAEPQIRPLSEIRETLRSDHLNAVNHSIPMVGTVEFDAQPTPIDPYLLGVLLGDGSLSSTVASISTADIEIVDACRAALPPNTKIEEVESGVRCRVWTITHLKRSSFGRHAEPNAVVRGLRDLKLQGTRSHDKFVPDIYKFNTPEVRLRVLRGLMDTDGSVSKRGHSTYFYTVSAQLADDVVFLVRSFGGIVTRSTKTPWYIHNGERRQGSLCHVLCVTLPAEINPFLLKRKADLVKPKTRYVPARYIVGVEPVGKKPAQCIRIAHPSHLYVTDEFIVTHNTFEIAAAAMEMRRLGTAKKPMIIVPNSLVAQWAQEFMMLYPNANLFVAGEDTFAKGNRQQAMSRIANGDYDAVIVSYESFGKLPVSDDTFDAYLQEQIDELMEARAEAEAVEGKGGGTVKDLQKAIKRLEARVKKRAKREKKDITITFEEMGIDQLFADESQKVKALGFATKMTRVAGLPNRESDRAVDMFLKTRWLTRKRGGKGVTFATGTPIANTMAEMYTVMRYLLGDQLKGLGLNHFDAWAAQYGETVTSLELAPSGKGYRMNNRFAKFVNLPELVTMFRTFADVQTAEMLKLPVPKLKGGKPIIVAAEASEELNALIGDEKTPGTLVYRAGHLPKGRAAMQKGADNMLKITGDGRKAGLDMRLAPPVHVTDPVTGLVTTMPQRDHPGSKVNMAVDKVFGIWNRTKEQRSTQLIFSDLSTPKPEGGGFSAYNDIRDKLIARGVPAEEIAFIHDYDTQEKRKKLFRAVNDGRVRILLGSSEKMGVGMNVQKKLLALHHLDAPWRPCDIEQREGRIMRQGNDNPEVEIYRYVTKGSFDAYMWQTLETKARFIAQVMRGEVSVRSAEDVEGTALTYAEIKGIASGDERVMEKIQTDIEVRRLDMLRAAHANDLYNMRREAAGAPRASEAQHASLEESEADLKRRNDAPDELWRIGGETFTGKDANKEAGAKLHEMLEADRAKLQAAYDKIKADYEPRIADVSARYEIAKVLAEVATDDPNYVKGSKAAFERIKVELVNLHGERNRAFNSLQENWKHLALGTYRGFELIANPDGRWHWKQGAAIEDKEFDLASITVKGAKSYRATANTEGNPTGTLASIRYHIEGIDRDIQILQNSIAEQNKKLKDLQELINRPFEHEAKLKELLVKQARLNDELDISKATAGTQGMEQEAPAEEPEKAVEPEDDEGDTADYLDPHAPEEDRRAREVQADERLHNQIREEQNKTNPDLEKIAGLKAKRRAGESSWTEERRGIEQGLDAEAVRKLDPSDGILFGRRRIATPAPTGEPQLTLIIGKGKDPVTIEGDATTTSLLSDVAGHAFGGVSLTSRGIQKFRIALGAAIKSGGLEGAHGDWTKHELMRVLHAFNRAASLGKPIIYVFANPENPAQTEATRRHETAHYAQKILGKEVSGRLSDTGHIDPVWVLKDPLGKKAAWHLVTDLDYENRPYALVAEIGAHLAEGPSGWKDMGLTPPEAERLRRIYRRGLLEKHQYGQVYRQPGFTPILKSFYDQSNPAYVGRGSANEAASTEQGGGIAGGPQAPQATPRQRLGYGSSARFAEIQSTGPGERSSGHAEGIRTGREESAGDRGLGTLPSADTGAVGENAPSIGNAALSASHIGDGEDVRFARRVAPQPSSPATGHRPPATVPTPLLDKIAAKAAQSVVDAKEDLQKTFYPYGLSPEAKSAGLSLREHAAEAARTFARAEEALKVAHKIFSTRPWHENLDFINRVEDGSPQRDPALQGIADIMRGLLDSHREAVQALGKNKLTAFYENYFPHIWERRKGQDPESTFRAIFGKRPIEGTKAFLKQRKFKSFQEGVDAGLTPVSENPVDLVMLKLKEMERYTLAHRFLNEQKENGLAKYVPSTRKAATMVPKGWVKVPDPIGTVWGPPVIRIPEMHDKQFVDTLLDLADKLGVNVQRVAKLRSAWGRSFQRPKPVVKTRFAGPESVILHELGHQMDWKYDLQDQLVNHPDFKKELRDLADLRLVGNDTEYFQQYIRRGEEKIANMIAAYGHAPNRFKKVAPKLFAWFQNFIGEHPELAPLKNLSYGLQQVVHNTEYPVGGWVHRGDYYMPPGGAQIVSNYLAPGLGGKGYYQALRGASNLMLQFALGFSGFHAGFVTFDAMVSRLAVAMQYLAAGKPLDALKLGNPLAVAYSPIRNVRRGNAIRDAYLKESLNDPELAKYVDAIVQGGGRVKMDEQYRTKMREAFLDAIRKGDKTVAGLTALPALAELAMWPILEYLVPRMKLGAFADMVDFELKRLGPDATKEQVREAFAGAWDSVDNRMGQLVYDNLFWKRTAKDLMMLTVQSVGWNLGTAREFGGALVDVGRAVPGIGRRIGGGGGSKGPPGGGSGSGRLGGEGGEPPEQPGEALGQPGSPLFTRRIAYALATVLLTATVGAITNYINTKGRKKKDGSTDNGLPADIRDPFFPRTGNIDEQGHDERMALPGYLKDLVGWYMEPGQAGRNKLSPIVRLVAEMIANRTFYGEKISDPSVSWGEFFEKLPANILSELKHLASFFEPMAVSGLRREKARGAGPGMQGGQFVGVRTAPAYITRTPAQRYMEEWSRDHRGDTDAPSEATGIEREITKALRAKDWQRAFEIGAKAAGEGKLTEKQWKAAQDRAAADPLVSEFQRLPLDAALQARKLMSAEERKRTDDAFDKKIEGKMKTAPPAEQLRILQKLGQPGVLQ